MQWRNHCFTKNWARFELKVLWDCPWVQHPSLFPLSFWNGFCFFFFSSSPWSHAGGAIWFMSYWSVTSFYKLSVFFLLHWDFRSSSLCFSLEWSLFSPPYSDASLSLHTFSLSVRLSLEKVWSLWRTGLLIRGIHHCNAQSREKSAFPVWNNNHSVWREHSK